MIQVANSIEIRRPIADVFAFVADARNNPQWLPVESVTPVSDGPVGPGYKFRQKFQLMGAAYNLDGTITSYQPNQSIGFNLTSQVFQWRGAYNFESNSDGTKMIANGTIELRGSLRVAEPIFAPKIRQLIVDTAPKLKHILENQ